MIPISLADILTALDHISEVWRSDTAVERRTDLADLDDLLARLDDMEPQHPRRPSGSRSHVPGSRA